MLWWEVLVQQTINGLTRGAVFALIALGYTMVYGIIELINFAHGDVFMLGLFISLAWFSLLGVTRTLTGWHLVTLLPVVFVLTMLTTAARKVSSSWMSSTSLTRVRKASGSTRPPAGSMRSSRPSAATSSMDRTRLLNGPKRIPEPCVDVETTPATVWPS